MEKIKNNIFSINEQLTYKIKEVSHILNEFQTKNNDEFDFYQEIEHEVNTALLIDRLEKITENLIPSFLKESFNPVFISTNSIDILYSFLNKLDAAVNELLNELKNIPTDKNQIETLDNNFSIMVANNKIIDLKNKFISIISESDHILESLQRISFIASKPYFNKASKITDINQKLGEEINNYKKNAKNNLLEIEKTVETVKDFSGKTQNEYQVIHDFYKSIEAKEQDFNEKINRVLSKDEETLKKYASIEDTYQKALSLDKEIEKSNITIKDFANSVEQRISQYQTGIEQLKQLLSNLQKQEKNIEEINQKALEALRCTTIVGLAKEYNERKENLDEETQKAFRIYVKSIVFLSFISFFPISYLGAVIFAAKYSFNIHILVTLLLTIVPAILFTRFCSANYHNLFRLREQYAHKYATAFSMDGFCKQLDDAKRQELIATTFASLAEDHPVQYIQDKKSIEKHPLPFWEKFINFLLSK